MPSSEAIFEALDSIHCGLLIRGRNNEIALLNDRLAGWLGYTRQELVGRPTLDLFPPELHAVIDDERTALDAGDTRPRLTVIQRRDSSTFPVVVIPNQLFDDDGKSIGGVSLIIDLASVQTAKPAGYHGPEDLSSQLSRIAFELQTLGLAVSLPSGESVPLHHPELESLSPREREILAHLIAGDRVPSIAKQLYISEHTVRNHLKSMYRKLDVPGQSDLIDRVRSLRKAS